MAPRPVDRILAAEVVLGLVLLALFLALYMVPAERSVSELSWWATPVLVGLFFALVGLDAYRRKQRNRASLRRVIREEAERYGDDPIP